MERERRSFVVYLEVSVDETDFPSTNPSVDGCESSERRQLRSADGQRGVDRKVPRHFVGGLDVVANENDITVGDPYVVEQRLATGIRTGEGR